MADGFAYFDHFISGLVPEKNTEFIPAQAEGGNIPSAVPFQDAAELLQAFIPLGMAVGIIQMLEGVQVKHRKKASVPGWAFNRLQQIAQRPAVMYACQRVRDQLLMHLDPFLLYLDHGIVFLFLKGDDDHAHSIKTDQYQGGNNDPHQGVAGLKGQFTGGVPEYKKIGYQLGQQGNKPHRTRQRIFAVKSREQHRGEKNQ